MSGDRGVAGIVTVRIIDKSLVGKAEYAIVCR